MIHIFIMNPVAGSIMYMDELRAQLDAIPDITYYIFTLRYPDSEAEIVRRAQSIFEGEKLRFYVCGGAGTFAKVMAAFDRLDTVDLAYYPCGTANDFINVFGDNGSRFHDIKELINGDVIDIDYIKTNHGLALNAFSLGLNVSSCKIYDRIRDFGRISKGLPYTLANIHSILVNKTMELELFFDNKRLSGVYAEVFFGNGYSVGKNLFYDEKAEVDDGRALVSLIPNRTGIKLIPYLNVLRKKDIETLRDITETVFSRRMRVVSKNGEPLEACLDGNITEKDTEWDIEIVNKGLHFVVPKGVRV